MSSDRIPHCECGVALLSSVYARESEATVAARLTCREALLINEAPFAGVVGVALFGLLFSTLPRNPVSLAVVAILLIFSFKTSYQFFTIFDGSYLLVWLVFIGLLNKTAPARQAVSPNYFLKQAGS